MHKSVKLASRRRRWWRCSRSSHFFRCSASILNWDDQDVFVRNDALRASGVTLWAFTTRYMEHYQPLAWLDGAGVHRSIGLSRLPRTA